MRLSFSLVFICLLLSLCLSMLLSGTVAAAEPPTPGAPPGAPTKIRENVWSVGFQNRLLRWGEEDEAGLQLHFMSQTLDVSRVWVKKHWWASIDLSLVLGPVSRRLPDSPPIDFTGNGFGFRFAYPLFSDGLRQANGDWGLMLGAESMEIRGNSYRRQVLSDGGISEGWLVRSRWISVIPGLFYSCLKAGRPKGNRPEWLVTRLEGYTIQLGLGLPIKGDLEISQTLRGLRERQNSRLRGYTGLLSFSAWLGI